MALNDSVARAGDPRTTPHRDAGSAGLIGSVRCSPVLAASSPTIPEAQSCTSQNVWACFLED